MCEREIGDLIEKQRAAIGELEATGTVGLGVGERASYVTEELALEHTVGDSA